MRNYKGSVQTSVVLAIVFGGISIIMSMGIIWLTINYLDQKNNVDSKINTAVADAKKAQADELEKEFADREKEPLSQFTGPEDLGRLVFKYPKTWSVYVKETNGYRAFFHPKIVVSENERFALRLTIETRNYDEAVQAYSSLVKSGSLTSSPFSVGDVAGTRFDGNFTKDLRGSAIIVKNRDKVVTLQTDADTFKSDFDALIQTISLYK